MPQNLSQTNYSIQNGLDSPARPVSVRQNRTTGRPSSLLPPRPPTLDLVAGKENRPGTQEIGRWTRQQRKDLAGGTARKGDLFAKTEKEAKSRLDFADYSDGASWVEFAGELREMRILPKLTTLRLAGVLARHEIDVKSASDTADKSAG